MDFVHNGDVNLLPYCTLCTFFLWTGPTGTL